MITSPEEFFQRLAEIQQQTRSVEVKMINPSNEPRFVIDADTRMITIPAKMKSIGVYTDHNAETIYFEIARYFDSADLTQKACVVQYINAANEQYVHAVTNKYIDGDKLIVSWTISDCVTKAPGKVEFAVRFYELEESEGGLMEFAYNFNTVPAIVEVERGLNIMNSPEVRPNGDDLSELVAKINDIFVNGSLQLVSYNDLRNKPTINGVEIKGHLSGADLGIPSVDQSLNAESKNPVANAAITQVVDALELSVEDLKEEVERIDKKAVVADETLNKNSTNPIQNKPVAEKFFEIDEAIVELQNKKVDMDSTLDENSTNPVENQAITKAINELKEEIAGLTYVPIAISNFTTDVSVAEKGSTINTVTFSWNLSKTPITLTLNDQPVPDFTANTFTLFNQSITDDTTFVLKATDRSGEVSAETAISFMNGLYYGAAAETEVDSAFVLTLNKELKKDLSVTFSANAEANQFIYFAAPESYGEPIFTVGGFDGGFAKITAIEFSNEHGHTENYNIYRSDNMNLGNTTIKVS